MNSDISAQDETIINEILDKGINQIRLNHTCETNKSHNTSSKTYEYNSNPKTKEHSPFRRERNHNNNKGGNIPVAENRKEKEKYLNKAYNTITSGELYNFKNDLKSLQDNIDRIEHKLFDKDLNSNCKLVSPMTTNTSAQNEIIDYTKSILGRSNHNRETPKEIVKTQSNHYADRNTNYNRDYELSLTNQLKDQESLINMLRCELYDTQKAKDDLSNCCMNLKEENTSLIKELRGYEASYKETSELKENFLRLRQDYDQLIRDYQISKDIRHEQNKIIKSLHNEIDYLRRNFDVKISKLAKEETKHRSVSATKEDLNNIKKIKKKKKLVSKSKDKPSKVGSVNKKLTANSNLKKISNK